MTAPSPDLSTTPDAFITSVVDRLAAGQPIRRSVPGGRLHIDRMLPFLFVYRHPADRPLEGADRLVHSQASYLSVSATSDLAPAVSRLVGAVSDCVVERLGAFLVVELWPAAGVGVFRVVAPPAEPATTVAVLVDALSHVDVLGEPAVVETSSEPAPAPPTVPPLLSADDQRRHGALLVGLEVPAFFLDPQGRPFPAVLRRLQHDLAGVLQQAAFEFTTVQTKFRPEHFQALGRRRLLHATRRADEHLAEVAGAVDHLLAVTPMDADEAWAAFREQGFRGEPAFHYRPLRIDPDLLKRALFAIPLEEVEDPTLAALFREKRRELDRQLSLLEDRGSAAFLPTSLQLYGGVDDALVALAERVLDRLRAVDAVDQPSPDASPVDALAVAARAREELAWYRDAHPDLETTVVVRDDVPGIMVSGDELLVGTHMHVSPERLDALIEHEIGVHVVTAENGRVQPLRLLRVGLPAYEETQEALGVLAEFLTGGLTARRLQTLAARVVAVRSVTDGATFVETFEALRHRQLAPARAFTVAMRVHRSGGLTKDAIYLRGLDRLLRHLAAGHPLEPLLLGKLALEHIPVVEELRWRAVLAPPRLRPRWLDRPAATERMAAVRHGLTVLDLVPEAGP